MALSEVEYHSAIARAVELDHDCDDNACDIAGALRAGFPIAAAHLLQVATECPHLEAFLAEHGEWPVKGGWPVEFDEWAAWFKANTVKCESCGAYNFTDESTPYTCANCAHDLPRAISNFDDDD